MASTDFQGVIGGSYDFGSAHKPQPCSNPRIGYGGDFSGEFVIYSTRAIEIRKFVGYGGHSGTSGQALLWRKLSFRECSFSALGAVTSNVPTQQGKLSRRLCLVENLNLNLDESRYSIDDLR